MIGVLMKRGNLGTDISTGRTPCEDEDRNQGDASAHQEPPKVAGHHQKPGERLGQILPHGLQREPALQTP